MNDRSVVAKCFAGVLALAAAPVAALAQTAVVEPSGCGGADAPCALGDRSFHVLSPGDAFEGPRPVVVHLHGAGSTGRAVIRGGMARAAVARGYVVIAPTGRRDGFGRFAPNWGVRDGREGFVEDLAFIDAVVDAVSERVSLDRDRMLLAGFSRGGSFVWDVACAYPERFDGYVSVAGGFWEPMTRSCAGPVRLLHIHGWRDRTVPLEGRPLGSGRAQGDIHQGLIVWRRTNGCSGQRADAFETEGDLWTRRWIECDAGALEFIMHPGGHGAPRGWAARALDWFEETLDGR